MKSFAVLALFASLVAQGYAVTINTPASLVQCQPALLSWSDGTAPYFPSIIPGGQPSAAALKTFDSTDATQLTWTVDLPAGTSVTLALRDSTGEQVFSDTVTISSSSDDSCVNTSVAESASAASGGATTSAASDSASPVTTGSAISSAATRAASQASGSATGTSSTSTISNSHAAGLASSTSHSFSASRSTVSSSPSAGSADASTESESANSAVRGSTMNAVGIAGLLGFIGAALL